MCSQDRIDARRATRTASRCLLRLRFSQFPIVDFTERRAHKSRLLVFGQSVRETERARPVRDRSTINEQLSQLGDVGGDAPSLIAGQQFDP